MATLGNVTYGLAGSNPAGNNFELQKLDAAKYISLYDLVNKPDNRDALIKTYGNQGITGFLQLVGATKAVATNDEVQYWEEERLHKKQAGTLSAITAGDATATITAASAAAVIVRLQDVVLVNGSERGLVTAISTAAITVTALSSGGFSAASSASVEVPIVGNLYAQGSDQPTEFIESGITKRVNPFMIMKEVYSVTGSQATNIGWINLGNGDYRWYIKSENDTRQRFLDKREMMMLLGEKITSGLTGYGDGSEGYFSAIENRGIVNTGGISTLTDLDALIVALDKQGAAAEYAVYVNRSQDLNFDDMIANGVGASLTAGVMTQFGSFNNSAEMAAHLGFASFMRGSYGFHKHSWKLLNEPTLLAGSKYQGVMIPLTQVADPRTGSKAPALEMNYKSTNGYSREMEHWMTGSILGVTNANDDSLQFNYRSECNLVTRAANQHVLLKSA